MTKCTEKIDESELDQSGKSFRNRLKIVFKKRLINEPITENMITKKEPAKSSTI